ncbi:phosphofurin acidic cluster sorting protein 2 isoform X1 [Lingula anatina]|uniref:Phosphofurin acidic cluster sorting protein 2 isoform X1 n=1 Tax=Lingula anatina TaxID=7574 RepID=A0A2R2MN02_LINAN|nr:phosphofurin acidic cluster sorting protein 2 isoform X1 [Lingula anatina]|eukprot:XP_023931579.1 phosphofurin acidic cluster sorting protein 2 isoform X1 [Lingula anatina]
MADSGLQKMTPLPGHKPVPQNLYATWEIDKSSPNCIPRLCTLKLTRLMVLKPLEQDLTSIIIAVKMQIGSQGSKRTLRTTEIVLQPNGTVDTELDITFILQYPHFFKRDGNKLQIMLQRRKKYKNRTILGYKTLAVGTVNMAQVLQRAADKELVLYPDIKDAQSDLSRIAQVTILALSSQPVDKEENGRRKHQDSVEAAGSGETDDDDQEDSSNEEGSDSETCEIEGNSRPRKGRSRRGHPRMARQRNLKQKFFDLLRKLKVSEEVLDSEQDPELGDQLHSQQEIEELFDELEDLSDSGPEMDNLSVLSTPKPSLRPFFTNRAQSVEALEPTKEPAATYHSDDSSKKNDSDGHGDDLDPELSEQTPAPSQLHKAEKPGSPVAKGKKLSRDRSISLKEKKVKKENRPAERRSSVGNNDNLPRKILLDQLGAVLQSDEHLPEYVIFVNACEGQGQLFSHKIQERHQKVICTCSNADVKATIQFIVNKIQKFCHSNSRNPNPIKLAIVGNDSYVNAILKPWVEQFAAKSPDWQGYIRFLIIPLGGSVIGKYLASIDGTYNAIFNDSLWKDSFDKTDSFPTDFNEILNRVSRYLKGASQVLQLPLGEAMLTCSKGKSHEEESSQIFIPFISEMRLGPTPGELSQMSVDIDDSLPTAPASGTQLSSSPPASSDKQKDSHTPPNSPSVSNIAATPASQSISPSVSGSEYQELQLDYWTVPGKTEREEKSKKEPKDNKSSLKTAFRSIKVSRLPPNGEMSGQTMSMVVYTKEKKQKMIRIGKKSKDTSEAKREAVEGISRMICTTKSQNSTLSVVIDGHEWTGVKFFQLSSQWQTHIKHFPVAIFGHVETAC